MSQRAQSETARPKRRAVLLGASNLALGLPSALAAARAVLGGPIEALAAPGAGRSYGLRSAVLARSLPGILECGLWAALRSRPCTDTSALVTDIGNDLPNGVPVATLAGWVKRCLEELAAAGARTVVTLLPERNIEALGPARYYLFRTVLFPRSCLGLEEARERARELNARLREAAGRHGAHATELDPRWYGIDPLHFLPWRRTEAWLALLEPWRGGAPGSAPAREIATASLGDAVKLLLARPERWWIAGIPRSRRQPCAVLGDGTTLELY
ncbi:MAG: hypothetical protein HY721_00085 [Planctomycetes bacterium]|nr:hypothetical protein [Planctomycetota bacterium]